MASSAETSSSRPAALVPSPASSISEYRPPARLHPDLQARSMVDYSPCEVVKRHSEAWSGLLVETVQLLQHRPFEYGFRAPCHLLIAAELGERHDGEAVVQQPPGP